MRIDSFFTCILSTCLSSKKLEPEEAQLPRQRRLLTAHDMLVLLPAAADASGDAQVHVIASLPCYSADNVEKQRGRGVFARSIEVRAGLRSRFWA